MSSFNSKRDVLSVLVKHVNLFYSPASAVGNSAPVVAFSENVVFDGGVVGMPHIFDSVVLTCDPTDEHIADCCSGVNDEDDVMFSWP